MGRGPLGFAPVVATLIILILDRAIDAAERSYQREPRSRGSGLPPFWRTVTLFNPLVYLISGFRWSFFDIGRRACRSLAITLGFLVLCMAIVS